MKIRELFENDQPDYTQIENLPLKAKIKLIRGKGGKVPLHTIEQDQLVFDKQLKITASYLDAKGEIILPIKKTGQLMIDTAKITSFKNCPTTVRDGGYTMGGNNWAGSVVISCPNGHLTSLEGFPRYGLDGLRLAYAYNLSYHNVHKYISEIKQNSIFEIASDYEGPLLGFFKIKGLLQISTLPRVGSNKEKAERLQQARTIIYKHLKGDRNIVACQEELFKNGLDEYAQL